jgi:aspartyl-tRNA synthetase
MRSHYCGDVRTTDIDQTVEFSGWVNRRRDHGGVIFIDLRDRSGLVQVVYDPDLPDVFATGRAGAQRVCVRVKGRVRARPEGTTNPDLPTGEVEVLGLELEILNRAETPPFQLDDDDTSEELRLRYRYVDLRRPVMQERIMLRAKATRTLRHYLDDQRLPRHRDADADQGHAGRARATTSCRAACMPGKFFALPQSPQLFKQLLMMSGMDRYYQIVRCFRDEDLRADRQPEFTQLDLEMSFMTRTRSWR